jgi:hypothetical protein
MEYERIREAAEARMGGESTGAWKLADALAAEIPEQKTGPKTDGLSNDLITKLQEIAARLLEDGIETPAGGSYTAEVLRQLRLVALAWPKAERHREAAFRTHQEVGASDPWKREVFAAICNAARSGDFSPPKLSEGEVDDEAWLRASTSIAKKRERDNRYPVSANDVRVAFKRKTNVPSRNRPEPAKATPMDAIEAMQEGSERLEYAAKVLMESGQPIEDVREAIEGLITRLSAALDFLRSYLTTGGITDAALATLLSEGDA